MSHSVRIWGLVLLAVSLLAAYIALTLAGETHAAEQNYIGGMLTLAFPGALDALAAKRRIIDVKPDQKPALEQRLRDLEAEKDSS